MKTTNKINRTNETKKAFSANVAEKAFFVFFVRSFKNINELDFSVTAGERVIQVRFHSGPLFSRFSLRESTLNLIENAGLKKQN